MTADEVKALFAADGEAVEVDDGAEPADDAEIAALISSQEPAFAADEWDLAEVGGAVQLLQSSLMTSAGVSLNLTHPCLHLPLSGRPAARDCRGGCRL